MIQYISTSYQFKVIIMYSEKEYHHIVDQRTQEQRQLQHQKVEWLVQRNLKAFKVALTDKKKVVYHPKIKERLDLGDGWYCYITDSKKKSRHNVLTLHGAPGDHLEWAGLETQMGDSCRWINLTIPGFDGQDERRGSYNGTTEDLTQLILRIMLKLRLVKIIICAHSLGSIFCSHFITKWNAQVEGYINITGIVDLWYTGLLTFFNTVITLEGYNSQQWRDSKAWDDDHMRNLIYHKFLEVAVERSFGPVSFPQLSITEFFGYMKLINTCPNGLSQYYGLNKNLKKFRVLFFGKKDPLHEIPKTQASIYNVCWGEESYINLPYYQKLFKLAKEPIEKRLKEQFDVQIQADKLQEYFCYHFHDTGHNAHKRRPVQMSKIMKIYMVCLEVIDKYQIQAFL